MPGATLILLALWRPFIAWISSNLVFLGRSRFLVSIGPNFAQFRVTIVKISHLEERWCSVENSVALFVENSFLLIHGGYRQAHFMEGSWDTIIQSCLGRLLQLWLSWYNFLHENGPKIALFDLKIVIYLIKILVFYWYLIRFNYDYGLWPIVSKGKSCPKRWSKIWLDRMVISKGQYFVHP